MATLYVVATPIGNLGDMTPRAIDTLKQVALIAAEDTRVTQRLLNAFDIHTPLTSYHAHNERSKSEWLVERMCNEDIDIAITTDAGTPCISDPGSVIVKAATEAGIEVIAIAGPSAMAATLSVSGFTVCEFGFVGFLPRQKKELTEKLYDIAKRLPIAVVHESPHRVINLMEIIASILPNTEVSASCDLTKKHELTLRGNVTAVLEELKNNPKANKGEYCIALCFDRVDLPVEKNINDVVSLESQLVEKMLNGLSLRDAMTELISEGHRKNAVYTASLQLKALKELL